MELGTLGTPGGGTITTTPQGKEKRTPKANQLYLNFEFVSGKDRMLPPEKLKPKGSSSATPTTPGVKKGGNRGKATEGRGGDGRRHKVEAVRAKRRDSQSVHHDAEEDHKSQVHMGIQRPCGCGEAGTA
jgi:hypothetical protein